MVLITTTVGLLGITVGENLNGLCAIRIVGMMHARYVLQFLKEIGIPADGNFSTAAQRVLARCSTPERRREWALVLVKLLPAFVVDF